MEGPRSRRNPSPPRVGRSRGGALRGGVPPLAIVWPCPLSVDEYAAAGREVAVPRASCPECGTAMTFRSGYWRKADRGRLRIFVCRGQCRRCDRSHALLPAFCLVGRLDPVEVIGGVLARVAAGAGVRPAAAEAGVPHTTARDWRRRHRARAPALAVGLAGLVAALGGPPPRLSVEPERAAVEAAGACWAAARRRFGGRTPSLWRLWSLVTGGTVLDTATNPPTTTASGWVLMPSSP
jgi:hypothetical protein